MKRYNWGWMALYLMVPKATINVPEDTRRFPSWILCESNLFPRIASADPTRLWRMPEKKTINFNISGQEVQFSNDQGRAVGMEIVLSTPNAKFHFFFYLKKCRNIVLERNYVIWSGNLTKFSANCPPLFITHLVTLSNCVNSPYPKSFLYPHWVESFLVVIWIASCGWIYNESQLTDLSKTHVFCASRRYPTSTCLLCAL